MKKKIQNKLGTYLAVTAGVGCASSVANAAVVFYGNASNPNIQADPVGIAFTFNYPVNGVFQRAVVTTSPTAYVLGTNSQGRWTRGDDFTSTDRYNATGYYRNFGWGMGAIEGINYANITFNNPWDNVYEAVAQFYLDGLGGGYLMAIATLNAIPNMQDLSAVGGPALSISAGKAMIDGAMGMTDQTAAIPEPSSLALLALGATGLAARRQRRKAA